MISLWLGVTQVRVRDGDRHCSGTPEVFHEGMWKRLSQSSFNIKTVKMVCRDLACGDVVNVSFKGNFINDKRSEIGMEYFGSESAVLACRFSSAPHSGFLNITPVPTCFGTRLFL